MKIKEGYVLEKVGGAYLAVAVGARVKDFSGLVRMNATGAFLWNLLTEKDMTQEELFDAVMAEYDGAPEEQVRADILSFETKLRENGIIE